MTEQKDSQKPTVAGIIIGIGMGGFVDGIVFHQILQWHNMLSNVLPPETVENIQINMVWDGVFHAVVWIITLIGLFQLWNAAYNRQVIPSFQAFVGQLMLGWGLFNLVEGIIDHQILAIHYVRQVPNYTMYNLAFLAVGGLLFLVGWLLMRRNETNDGHCPPYN